jgi:hypothetical protein
MGCGDLASVTLPTAANLNIGNSVFENCKKLTTVTYSGVDPVKANVVELPNTVAAVGTDNFKGTGIKEALVHMTGAITYNGTWFGGSNLEKVTFEGNGFTAINYALTSIKEIVWDSTATLNDAAVDFTGCEGLEKLTVTRTLSGVTTGTPFTSRPAFKDLVIVEDQTGLDGTFVALPASVTNVTIGPKYDANGDIQTIDIQNSDGDAPMFNAAVKNFEFVGPFANTFAAFGSGSASAGDLSELNLYFRNVGTTNFVVPLIAKFRDEVKTVRLGKGISGFANNFEWDRTVNLAAFIVDNDNPSYSTLTEGDGVLYNKAKTTLIRYPRKRAGTTYSIPESVLIIDTDAFRGNTNITTITIPEKVQTIRAEAFTGTGLTNVTYEAISATTTGASVFPVGLTKFKFGEKVGSIPTPFFAAATVGITEIDIPELVTFVGGSFANLTGLTDVTFRAQRLTTNGIFANMATIENVKIGKNVEVIPGSTFEGTGVALLDLGGVKTIGDSAFRNCLSLVEIEIPRSCTSIGDLAFIGCSILGQVSLPSTGISMALTSWVQKNPAAAIYGDLKDIYSLDAPDGGPGIYTLTYGSATEIGWKKSK